jgi:hypothetical protein
LPRPLLVAARGSADRRRPVRYRKEARRDGRTGCRCGTTRSPNTDEELADYRGSIVDLAPGTAYEVQLTSGRHGDARRPQGVDVERGVPVRGVVRAADGDKPLAITESGNAPAYGSMTAAGSRSTSAISTTACITIDASYVIVRGFTLKGAGLPGGTKAIGAIRSEAAGNIVIEECDISGWGRTMRPRGSGVD